MESKEMGNMFIINPNTLENLEAFTEVVKVFYLAYCECIMFTEEDQGEDEGLANMDLFAQSTQLEMMADCIAFIKAANGRINLGNAVFAGHDLWFTRNGHGVGFWSRPEIYTQVVCDELTALCGHGTNFYDKYASKGDDGLIYLD